jgi:hypothetical protein
MLPASGQAVRFCVRSLGDARNGEAQRRDSGSGRLSHGTDALHDRGIK